MVHDETLVLIFARDVGIGDKKQDAYLGIKIVQRLNGVLDVSTVNGLLNTLTGHDLLIVLLRLKVGLLGEVGSGLWVTLHGKVVKDEGIDVATG